MFGGTVGVVSDDVYHLRRSEIYTIDGHKIFTFGGGQSIDKEHRTEWISWWRNELPSSAETDRALQNLADHDNSVDLIFSHEAPKRFVMKIMKARSDKDTSPLAAFFDTLYDEVSFAHWYCGHYHVPFSQDKLSALYNDLVFIPTKENRGEHYNR